jgi:hypothetical protein
MKIFSMIIAAIALGACKPKTEFSGIGQWSVTQSSLAVVKAKGRCQQSDLPDGRKGMWCFGLPGVKIPGAGFPPEVDVYFGSEADDARPVEIQFKFRGCNDEKLQSWVTSNFGAATETRTNRGVWTTGHMTLIGFLPQSAGYCMLRMFPLSEQAEIDRIKKL